MNHLQPLKHLCFVLFFLAVAVVFLLFWIVKSGLHRDSDREIAQEPEIRAFELPEGFVYLEDVLEHAVYEVRYFGDKNFLGVPVEGYERETVILSEKAARSLKNVEDDLWEQGYILKIFDGYRPQRAVDHFVRWAEDLDDTKMKKLYYPEVDKSQLFEQGYIAKKSGHSRGSTVDLTLLKRESGGYVDMGSLFDFFGPVSHHGAAGITSQQKSNREILKNAMEEHGFLPLEEEWWHYRLKEEPFPQTYFDFPVR